MLQQIRCRRDVGFVGDVEKMRRNLGNEDDGGLVGDVDEYTKRTPNYGRGLTDTNNVGLSEGEDKGKLEMGHDGDMLVHMDCTLQQPLMEIV